MLMKNQAMETSSVLTKTETATSNLSAELVSIEIFNKFDDLKAFEPQWDQFVESVGCEIFMTYDWCRLWWKYYGGERNLQIFVFRYHETLAGIIPVFFEKLWLGPVFIRAAKIVGTDFTIPKITLPIRKEFLQQVAQKFLEKLVTDYNWDVLHIGPIAGIFRDFDKLMETCQLSTGQSHRIRKTNETVQTYFMLAGSWDEQIASLSKKQQRILKQKYRVLHEITGDDTSIVSRFAASHNCRELFDRFAEMHQIHWQKQGKSGHFGDWPNSMQFHGEMAQEQLKHNRLRLLEVNAGKYNLGYKYGYRFGDNYMEFLDARSQIEELARASVGRIIFCEQMKKAVQERAKYIDSLGTQYEHKLLMGGKMFPVNNIYIYSRKPLSVIRVGIFRKLSWLLHICYYKIWFCRIAPKLPFKGLHLWKTWIRSHIFA